MSLAEKIQELRTSHNMSQECLAELLGVSRQAVSKWETGQSKPGTDHLIHLAAFSAALYTRFQGFSDITVFLCAAASAIFILSAFLPVLITILAFICRDCKKHGIRPAFYVFISLSAAA